MEDPQEQIEIFAHENVSNYCKFEQSSSKLSDALLLIPKLIINTQKYQKDKIIKLKYKINEKLPKNFNEWSISHLFDKDVSVVIAFEFEVDENVSKIFWKAAVDEKFYSLKNFKDPGGVVSEYCLNFLIQELERNHNGILSNARGKPFFDIRDIGNNNGRNLLIQATIENNFEIFKNLLPFGFNVEHEFIDDDGTKLIAIEKAWETFSNPNSIEDRKKQSDEIILSLLQKNSKLPDKNRFNFQFQNASLKVQDFIEMCEELHSDVYNFDIESLEQKIKSLPDLYRFYNRNNMSLMAYVLRINRFPGKPKERKNFDIKVEIYSLLSKYGIGIGAHEDVIYFFLNIHKECMRDHNLENAKKLPEAHIFTLLSKTKISSYDRCRLERRQIIQDAYEILDKNEKCSKILNLIAECKNIQIFLDFEYNTTFHIDPTTSKSTEGLASISGEITIGVKYLLDESRKFEAIGTIIHEFCHIAMLTTFMNEFDPYPMGESKMKKEFENVVVECENNKAFEEIVGIVFDEYEIKYHHRELIVRVVHMLMHYYVKDPNDVSENNDRIALCMKNYPKLFTYFKTIVEPELEKATKIFKRLNQKNQSFLFGELTEPMKARILHSNLEFQGEKTSLIQLIEENSDILKLLSTDDITKSLMLYNNPDLNWIILGDVCRINDANIEIQRKFISIDLDEENEENFKDSLAIKEEVKELQIFILADTAGAGKTTVFEELTRSIKKENKNCWVSFIKLRNYRDIFEDFRCRNLLESTDICEMLIKVLALKLQLEKEIFRKLFSSDKVILLLDGVDEISPDFNDFMIQILEILKKKTKNHLWISTRPQNEKQLSKQLSIEPFKLVSYSWEDKAKLILGVLKKFRNQSSAEYDEQQAINDFKVFFNNIDSDDFNNPLMITVLVELYACNKINLKLDILNIYDIFEKMFELQKEKVEKKIQFREKDPFEEFTIGKVHQALALKFLFDRKSTVYNLEIIDIWEDIKDKLSGEFIQRFGFVRVDSDFKDDFYIDFVHKTYSEFFVTKYIISMTFNTSSQFIDEVYENFLELLKIIATEEESSMISKFLLSYVKNSSKALKVHWKIRELMILEVERIYELDDAVDYNEINSIKFFSIFFLEDPETLKNELWKVNEDKNLLEKIVFGPVFNEVELDKKFEILTNLFGSKWHTIFSRSGMKLTKFAEKETGSKNFSKNLTKLLELIDKNWNISFNNTRMLVINEYFKEGMSNLKYEHINSETDLEILIFLCFHMQNEGFLIHLGQNIEEILKNNENDIKKVLFENHFSYDYNKTNLLFKAICSEREEIFVIFKNLYIKYEIPADQLKSFGRGFLRVFLEIQEKNYQDFVQLMKHIFKSKKDVALNCFMPYSHNDLNDLLLKEQQFELLEIFAFEFFSYENDKKNDFIRKILSADISMTLQTVIEMSCFDKFEKIIKIYGKYKVPLKIQSSWIISLFSVMADDNYQKIKEILFEQMKLSKIQIKLSLILISKEDAMKILKSKEFLKWIEKFLLDVFGSDEEGQMGEIFKEFLLFCGFEGKHPFEELIEDGNLDEFIEILNIFKKHLTYDDVQEFFESYKIFCKLLWSFSEISYETSKSFLIEIFGTIDICNNSCCIMLLYFLDEQMFFNEFYSSNSSRMEENLQNFLFNCCERCGKHALVSILARKGLNEFENVEKCYKKYKNSPELLEKIQEILVSKDILIKILKNKNMTDELLGIVQTFLREIFESNVEMLAASIVNNDNNINNFVQDVEMFCSIEKFLLNLFKENENVATECIKKILFVDYDGNHPLLNNCIDFEVVRNIFEKYSCSIEEFQEHFIINKIPQHLIEKASTIEAFKNDLSDKRHKKLMKFTKIIFESNENEILKCFDANFKLFKIKKLFDNFLLQFFDNEEEKVKNMITNSKIFSDFYALAKVLETQNLTEILEIFTQTKKTLTYVQDLFINVDNISADTLTESFSKTSIDVYQKLTGLLIEVFESNKEKILDASYHNIFNEYGMILNERKLELFEDFVNNFYKGNYYKIKEFLWKFLPIKYGFEIIDIMKKSHGDCHTFKRTLRLLFENSNSLDELQKIFLREGILIEIFSQMTSQMFPVFCDFISFIFESCRERLVECVSVLYRCEIFGNHKKFIFFESFLEKFLIQDQTEKCFRKLLFHNYKSDFHPLGIILKNSASIELNKIIELYENYKDSWEEVQNVFISNDILLHILKHSPNLNNFVFKNFIKKVFGSNKNKFLECLRNFECLMRNVNESKIELIVDYLVDVMDDDDRFREEIQEFLLNNKL